MTLYGLRGFTHHGGGHIVTVLSPAGRSAALEHMHDTDGLRVISSPERLTQYHEVRAGSVKALIRRYGIKVLDRDAWAAVKSELGADVYR